MVRTRLIVGALVVLLATVSAAAPASAADPDPAAPAAAPAAEGGPPAEAAAPSSSSSPSSSSPSGNDPSDASAGVPMVAASQQAASAATYGVGARFRVTSVPKWLLGLFLDQSVPLSSYTGGLEFFRRSGNFDLVIGVAYQNLSPKDGNWLGSGNHPEIDTDFIQFRGLASYSVDAAFILHTEFNEYVGMHYGGGVGIGIMKGKMLRTSAGTGTAAAAPGACTADNAGNTDLCYPVCDGAKCTETELQQRAGGTDGPGTPSRFPDNHIPAVYPIVNLVTGLDVHLPTVPGFAFKVDVGYFFPYFFAGASAAYQF